MCLVWPCRLFETVPASAGRFWPTDGPRMPPEQRSSGFSLPLLVGEAQPDRRQALFFLAIAASDTIPASISIQLAGSGTGGGAGGISWKAPNAYASMSI